MDLIHVENLEFGSTQFYALLPYFIVLVGGMVGLLMGVARSATTVAISKYVCFGSVLAAIPAVLNLWNEPQTRLFNQMLSVDQFSHVFHLLFLGATALVLATSWDYLKKEALDLPEFHALVLFSCFGMMLLAASLDLIVLFVSLEIMSIAVYVLVGFRRTDVRSNEAALKYFILGSAASAVFLYGAALMYGGIGTLNLREIALALLQNSSNLAQGSAASPANPLVLLGGILMAVGMLFKVAVVPFHMWMPDVYEGAPITVTAFMTTGLKAAAFAMLLRIAVSLHLGSTFYLDSMGTVFSETRSFTNVLWVLAVLTMFFGNVIALVQRNLKRMLAYSSIAHSGYLLVGILAGARADSGYGPVIVYLISYCLMNIGAFAVLSIISEKGDQLTDLQDLSGLGFKKPWLGFAMMIFMFSMAGLPPTVGFIGKYMIFSAAIQSGYVWLSVLAVICSAISAYFYLRVIVYMFMKEQVSDFNFKTSYASMAVVILAMVFTLELGILPTWVMDVAGWAASLLVATN